MTVLDTPAQYARFPPRVGNILIPLHPAVAGAGGTALYTACRPMALGAQYLLWLLARAGGARLLPGGRESWSLPYSVEVVTELAEQWRAELGGAVDAVAVYRRTQAARTGLVLLARAGSAAMIVRLRTEPAELDLERRISAAAAAQRPTSFRVPALRGGGTAGGMHWIGYEVISGAPHRPSRPADQRTLEQITTLVEQVVPRPVGIPGGWRGAHGDLTPWNHRRGGGRSWLIDWEDAGWAPPGADEVYQAVTRAALRRRRGDRSAPGRTPADAHDVARRYWIERLQARAPGGPDAPLIAQLLGLLGAGDGSGAPGHA